MDSSRRRTLGILISATIGLAACGARLYFEYRKPPSVVYRSSQEETAKSSANKTQSIIPDESAPYPSDLTAQTELIIAETLPEKIPVYLCGSVKEPGVYFITRGTYLFEVIKQAGGLNEEAAEEHINLVMILDTPVSVYIPSETELADTDIRNQEENSIGLIRRGANEYIWGSGDNGTNAQTVKEINDKKININTANEQELTALSGVGEVTAAAIIRFRSENGLFKIIEDIMKVPGIKQGRFDAIKDMIEV